MEIPYLHALLQQFLRGKEHVLPTLLLDLGLFHHVSSPSSYLLAKNDASDSLGIRLICVSALLQADLLNATTKPFPSPHRTSSA